MLKEASARQLVPALRNGSLMKGRIAVLLTIAIYAGFTLLSRHAALTSIEPLELASIRFVVGGLLLGPLLLWRGLGHVTWCKAVVMAAVGGIGFAFCCYYGLQLAPATHGAVLLHGMLPVFGVLAGRFLLQVPVQPSRWIGVATILLGVGATVAATREESASALLGDALLLSGSLCWALLGALSKRWEITGLQVAYIVTPLAAAMFLPVYVLSGAATVPSLSVQEWLVQGLFQGVVIAVVSPMVYVVAIHHFGAVRTSIATASVPVITMLGAYGLLGERYDFLVWLGAAVLTLGMVVAVSGLGFASAALPATDRR